MTEIRCSVELRQDDTHASPGRLYGVLLTEGERAGDRPEVFEPGSLEWPESGIVVNRQHARRAAIMRVIPERRGSQVVIDQALPDTVAGRDAATEVRSGLLTGLSVEFRAKRQRYDGGVRRITAALLTAAGLVDDPSYKGSRVEVRAKGQRRRVWL
ncbi:MAG: HK97 family phage prohead protease [Acidobacteria bacterium]|nr:HK97 family phage prohead protease [Acidobacteriota bacterium]